MYRFTTWWISIAVALVMGALLARNMRHAISISGSGDLTTVYAATRVWMHGHDPYDQSQVRREWYAHGGVKAVEPDADHTPSVYPPSTFIVMAPLAAFPWPTARLIWALLDLGMIAAIAAALPALAGVRWRDPRALALVAAVIALGPLRNGAMGGQPAIVVTGLIVLAALGAQRGWQWTPGVLLAIACAVKPPLAGPFLVYYALRGQWRLALSGAIVAVGLALVGVLRLDMNGVAWLPGLRANLHAAEAAGAINDPTAWSIKRFEMVNLQVLLHTLTDNSHIVALLVRALVGLAAIAFAMLVLQRSRDRRRELAELSVVAALALLPIYHRWYDAGVLVFVLTWGMAALPSLWRAQAIIAMVVVSASFVISPALWLARTLPHAAKPPFRYWRGVEQLVLPVQVWAIVLLAAMLLYVLSFGSKFTPTRLRDDLGADDDDITREREPAFAGTVVGD
ncbi:MAG TPA: glycosyltransferase family 87 protein [Tepidisphaeraceae bacterium]|nr:glycosyltransferase family 87 protein [Tepidisphaeraceae bacterium]